MQMCHKKIKKLHSPPFSYDWSRTQYPKTICMVFFKRHCNLGFDEHSSYWRHLPALNWNIIIMHLLFWTTQRQVTFMIVILHVGVCQATRNYLIPGNKTENVFACVWRWRSSSVTVFCSYNTQQGKRWIHAWERKLLKHKQDVNLNPLSAHENRAETLSPH